MAYFSATGTGGGVKGTVKTDFQVIGGGSSSASTTYTAQEDGILTVLFCHQSGNVWGAYGESCNLNGVAQTITSVMHQAYGRLARVILDLKKGDIVQASRTTSGSDSAQKASISLNFSYITYNN